MNQLAEMVIFARVVDACGFSAAARQLDMTTSAVSRGVARLERHIGGRLLHRSTRSVSVTELGREVYAGCARIAETAREVEALAGHYASAPSGRLKLSAPVTYGQVCVAPRLGEFLTRWPAVDVQLDLTDTFVDVIGESVDVAIRVGASIPLGLVARPLGRIGNLLVASRRYLGRTTPPAQPAELAQHAIVCPGLDTRLALRRGTAQVEVALGSRLRINDDRAILDAVTEGLGIGLVPDVAARAALERGELVQVLPEWSLAQQHGAQPVHALFSSTRHLPRKVRAFIDFLVGQPLLHASGTQSSLKEAA